jgi:predicted acetyltransferase
MHIAVKPVETRDELRKALDLMGSVHDDAEPSAAHWLQHCSTQYPLFRTEHARVAVHRHEVLAALLLTTDTIRIGEARLKMGGLGWVATSPRHRRKGICRQLINDTLRYMSEHGYHLSMLFGIPHFYEQFGYVTSMADYFVLMDTIEALSFASPFKSYAAKPGEVSSIQRIHNANDARVACSIVRTSGHMQNKWSRWSDWRLLKDDQGKAVAYLLARRDTDALNVFEVGVAERAGCAAVVRCAAEIAEEEGLARLRFWVPPTHVMGRFLTQFRSTHEMRVERDGGCMMRLVNTAETLESMIPEWESVLAASAAREWRTEFTLLVDGTPYRVRTNRGAVDVAATTGSNKVSMKAGDLAHLITGYRDPADVLAERHYLMSGEARTLFALLFPKRCPYVWRFDRF